MTERGFPWEEAMAFCLGVLRWSPDAFWRATPREVAAALGGLSPAGATEPMRRGELERLALLFPDG